MEALSTNITPGRYMRGAGVLGLYGGSVVIALALILAGSGNGSMSHIAAYGTGAVTNALTSLMSAIGAAVRLV